MNSSSRGLPAHLAASKLPEADRREVLRFDTRKLNEALDHARKVHGLTWEQVALQRPASEFVRLAPY